jgi:protein-tyrosine phosphatase
VDEAGLTGRIVVDSAATSAEQLGDGPDRRAVREASRRGVQLEHRAWQFGPQDFARFDYVVAVDDVNLRRLQRLAPDGAAAERIHLLRSYDPDLDPSRDPHQGNVPDPWYGEADGFVLAWDLMAAACAGLLDHLRNELDGA